jgi:hypothetical protein
MPALKIGLNGRSDLYARGNAAQLRLFANESFHGLYFQVTRPSDTEQALRCRFGYLL